MSFFPSRIFRHPIEVSDEKITILKDIMYCFLKVGMKANCPYCEEGATSENIILEVMYCELGSFMS